MHTEFVTLTWVAGPQNDDFWPEGIGLSAIGRGTIVAATMIEVLSETSVSQSRLDINYKSSLCFSTIDQSDAQVAADFVADDNGFTETFYFSKPLVTAILAPVVIGLIWYGIRRVTKLHGK